MRTHGISDPCTARVYVRVFLYAVRRVAQARGRGFGGRQVRTALKWWPGASDGADARNANQGGAYRFEAELAPGSATRRSGRSQATYSYGRRLFL